MKSLREHVDKAGEWLLSIRNSDGGWGIYEESASFVVSTAEALLGLERANIQSYEPSIQYLENILAGKYELKAQYQRHFAWAGYALIKIGVTRENLAINTCIDWLCKNQNSDGGWSHSPNGASSTYPTYLAMRLLLNAMEVSSDGSNSRQLKEHLDKAILWLVRVQNSDYGWGFSPKEESNLCATAYGLLALTDVYYSDKLNAPITNRTIQETAKFLYSNLHNAREVSYEPDVASHFKYPFHHFTLAWVLLSLVQNGYSIYDPRLWEGLINLLSLQSETGGWAESPQIRPTVWATYNALLLLTTLKEKFDPLDHLFEIAEVKISMEKEVEFLEKEVIRIQGANEQEVSALRQQISELELEQKYNKEEKLVRLGFRNLKLYLSKPLFWTNITLLIIAYIFFLSFGRSLIPIFKIISFIVLPILGYLIAHISGKQILGWSTENTVQLGIGVLGIFVTLHLVFVGL